MKNKAKELFELLKGVELKTVIGCLYVDDLTRFSEEKGCQKHLRVSTYKDGVSVCFDVKYFNNNDGKGSKYVFSCEWGVCSLEEAIYLVKKSTSYNIV